MRKKKREEEEKRRRREEAKKGKGKKTFGQQKKSMMRSTMPAKKPTQKLTSTNSSGATSAASSQDKACNRTTRNLGKGMDDSTEKSSVASAGGASKSGADGALNETMTEEFARDLEGIEEEPQREEGEDQLDGRPKKPDMRGEGYKEPQRRSMPNLLEERLEIELPRRPETRAQLGDMIFKEDEVEEGGSGEGGLEPIAEGAEGEQEGEVEEEKKEES